MSNWVEVGSVEDIPPLGARVVKNGDMDIAVFRNANDEVFAINDECPHKKGIRMMKSPVHPIVILLVLLCCSSLVFAGGG